MPKEPQKQVKQDLLPMPPVGTPVQWFEAGLDRVALPAIVLALNGVPGSLRLSVCNGTTWSVKNNVTWAPAADVRPDNLEIQQYGTWDYTQGFDIPDAHYQWDRDRRADRARRAAAEADAQRKLAAEAKPEPLAAHTSAVMARRTADAIG